MKIYAQAPTRVGLFGGSTDIESYASQYGGLVVNIAINIRQQLLFEDKKGTSKLPPGATPDFYDTFLKEFDLENTTITSEFDGVIGGGMGSSASAAVAIVAAINKYKKLNFTLDDIVRKAWDIEVNKIGLFGGVQDQIAAAYGGISVIEIKDNFNVISLNRQVGEKIASSLVLFSTGIERKDPKMQEGFKELSTDQIAALNQIKKFAAESLDPLCQGDIETVGRLMDVSWQLKKESNKGVSTSEIDEIYDKGLKNGAYGGKALGAGGGGCMVFVVDPAKKQEFIEKMELKWIDFSMDFQGLDCRII